MGATPVVWAPAALADRDALYAYIAARATPARAYAVLRRIVQATVRLGVFPESGRRIESGHRELVVPRLPYVIEYALDEETVHIVHIWHTAQRRHADSDTEDA